MIEFRTFFRALPRTFHERNRARNSSRESRRRDAPVVSRLRHERHRGPRAARCSRRPQARAPAHFACHARARKRLQQGLQEVRPRGRRRHRQIPPARRQRRVRRAGAHGAAVFHALPAGRRPGQLRLGGRRRAGRHALHRSAHVAHRERAARRHRKRNRRFPAELRRIETEPTVMPARFPNLLVNGSAGIAVGMATNVPPHNLTEIINACLAVLDDGEVTLAHAHAARAGSGFPDRRHHQRRDRDRHRLSHRPRPSVDSRAHATSKTSTRSADARPSSSPSCRTR